MHSCVQCAEFSCEINFHLFSPRRRWGRVGGVVVGVCVSCQNVIWHTNRVFALRTIPYANLYGTFIFVTLRWRLLRFVPTVPGRKTNAVDLSDYYFTPYVLPFFFFAVWVQIELYCFLLRSTPAHRMPNTRLRPQRTRIHQQQKTISNTDFGAGPESRVPRWFLVVDTHFSTRDKYHYHSRTPPPRV